MKAEAVIGALWSTRFGRAYGSPVIGGKIRGIDGGDGKPRKKM
jgi:hypothetical protein